MQLHYIRILYILMKPCYQVNARPSNYLHLWGNTEYE